MVDHADSALGMIETKGLVAAIEAADAMVKTADVSIVSVEQTVAALITIHVFGETAAVQAAVDAGRAAAERIGEVLSAHVIPRPDADVRELVLAEVSATGKGSTSTPPPKPARVTESATTAKRQVTSGGDLESMTVRELRSLARDTPGLPIQGREIARANKRTLLELLRKFLS
ncbi:MAG: BMC domain-containing protein [Rhodothermia bacterium]|nr:BMC domain-containing protein [Rhodothermia bacterium]